MTEQLHWELNSLMLVSDADISAYNHFPLELTVLLCIQGRISRWRDNGNSTVLQNVTKGVAQRQSCW